MSIGSSTPLEMVATTVGHGPHVSTLRPALTWGTSGGLSMKLFVLRDLQSPGGELPALLVRAESELRAREIASDQDAWKWRDPRRTTIAEVPVEGPSGVIWLEP